MKKQELINQAQNWRHDNRKFTNTETGNTVEITPVTGARGDIISVAVILYTPNKNQRIAEAEHMEKLYDKIHRFFQDYDKALRLNQ